MKKTCKKASLTIFVTEGVTMENANAQNMMLCVWRIGLKPALVKKHQISKIIRSAGLIASRN